MWLEWYQFVTEIEDFSMRALKFGLAGLALTAGSAFAVPGVWSIPSTLLNDGSTVSGTFTYDPATTSLSDINITSTGTNPGSFTFINNAYGPSVSMGQKLASISNGDKVFYIINSPLTSPSTPVSINIGIATCFGVNGSGLCTSASTIGSATVTVGAVVATTATVPTLSEYALMALASLMAMGGIWTMRKRGNI